MLRFISLISLLAALTACDTVEENVLSTQPMSEGTGSTVKDLNQRQTNVVDGMDEGGQINSYEEQQMNESIDGNAAPAK